MNPELKAKWVAALRGSEYQQAQMVLRNEYGFCCLGVLCEISGFGKWDGEHYRYVDGNDACGDLDGDEHFSLPSEVNNECVRLNDEGSPFAEIADYIESRTDV